MVDGHWPEHQIHEPFTRESQTPTAAQPMLVSALVSADSHTTPRRDLLIGLAAAMWLALSVLLVWRLLRGVIAGNRVLHSAAPCDEAAVLAALAAARDRLGMSHVHVDVYQSSAVRCPMIWCWTANPRLLLPLDSARDWTVAMWTPVLCHELAHWKRRDHWSALVAELVCCLMPWQGFAWWAKRRLEHASEQACDDWTVAVGHSAVDYAETLLGLVAQADPPLALAALRRRSGLAGRIHHLLSQAVPHPRLGRTWAIAVLLVAILSIGITAVCQRGVARAAAPKPAASPADEKTTTADDKTTASKPADQKPNEQTKPAPIANDGAKPAEGMKKEGAPQSTDAGGTPIPPVPADDEAGDKPSHYPVVGRVADLDNQPIADADVYWEIRQRKPDGQFDLDWPTTHVVAHTKTNDQGLYKLDAELVHNNVAASYLTVRAVGFGVHSMNQNLTALTPHNFELWPSYPVEGTIFTPDGEPAVGARVMITSIQRGSSSQGTDEPRKYDYFYLGIASEETLADPPRPYWPQPAFTDARGKFRIEDAVPTKAICYLQVQAEDFALTPLAVGHSDSHKPLLEQVYREPGFTLVLETPYVVDGRFLDEKTGGPIANARIEVQPYNNSNSTNSNKIYATSDADGRYTMRFGSADIYFIKIFTPLGYPAVQQSFSSRQVNQLAGADRKLKYEVKLRPGILLKGRVVDATSGTGVAGAQVYYKPESGRKLGVNDEFFPVTTADDGTFEATAVDGKGFLLVDAPGREFYRLTVHDPRIVRYREAIYPHGLLEIDVPSEGSSEPLVIALKQGPELVLRALDPNGNPVKHLRAACPESHYDVFFSGDEHQNGTFALKAAEPGRKYRVFLSSEDAKAGGVFEVEVPADGKPIDVKLEPWATVKGRYVYDGGAPAPEVTNFTRFRIYPDKVPDGNAVLNLPFYDNFSGHMHVKRVTDAEGNFELDGLIPGAFIYLNLNNDFAGGKRNYEVGILKPGEVKELGELVIHANR
ncbi:MAG: M56 family metallopeptidase [Pirellulales bacterium]